MAPFLVILSVAPWIFGAMGVAAAVAQAAVAAVDPAGHPAGHRCSTQVPSQDGEGTLRATLGPPLFHPGAFTGRGGQGAIFGPPRVRDNVRWEEAQYSCNFL